MWILAAVELAIILLEGKIIYEQHDRISMDEIEITNMRYRIRTYRDRLMRGQKEKQ